MELREFISETLIQITQGIEDAQEALKGSDCAINPRDIKSDDYASAMLKNKRHVVQDVAFNIALTNTSNSEDKAGIGVMLGALGIGGNKTATDSNASSTNISFTIPVAFPSVDNENKPVPIDRIPLSRRYHM